MTQNQNDGGPLWRHKKTGGTYERIGVAKIQTDIPLSDMDDVMIYRDPKTGQYWARRGWEFLNRFEPVEAKP